MATETRPYQVKVSDLQIQCLEIAGREVTEMSAGLKQTYQTISEGRGERGSYKTGSRIVNNVVGTGLDDVSRIFLGMAQSLRRKGRVEIVPIFEPDSGYIRPVSFGFRLFGNPEKYEEYVRPLQSFVPISWGVSNAVLSTLFDSDDLTDQPIKPLSSAAHIVQNALIAHRTVVLLYEPVSDYQI
jgi:hypothetical protein